MDLNLVFPTVSDLNEYSSEKIYQNFHFGFEKSQVCISYNIKNRDFSVQVLNARIRNTLFNIDSPSVRFDKWYKVFTSADLEVCKRVFSSLVYQFIFDSYGKLDNFMVTDNAV